MRGPYYTSLGRKAAAVLTAKEETAPRPTKVFILGDPRLKLCHPSTSNLRPGPARATRDKTMLKLVE